jgi:hypothetical protein
MKRLIRADIQVSEVVSFGNLNLSVTSLSYIVENMNSIGVTASAGAGGRVDRIRTKEQAEGFKAFSDNAYVDKIGTVAEYKKANIKLTPQYMGIDILEHARDHVDVIIARLSKISTNDVADMRTNEPDKYRQFYEASRVALEAELQGYCNDALCMLNQDSKSTHPKATGNNVYIADDGAVILEIRSDGSQMIINTWNSVEYHADMNNLIDDIYEFLSEWGDSDESVQSDRKYWYNLGVQHRRR